MSDLRIANVGGDERAGGARWRGVEGAPETRLRRPCFGGWVMARVAAGRRVTDGGTRRGALPHNRQVVGAAGKKREKKKVAVEQRKVVKIFT